MTINPAIFVESPTLEMIFQCMSEHAQKLKSADSVSNSSLKKNSTRTRQTALKGPRTVTSVKSLTLSVTSQFTKISVPMVLSAVYVSKSNLAQNYRVTKPNARKESRTAISVNSLTRKITSLCTKVNVLRP